LLQKVNVFGIIVEKRKKKDSGKLAICPDHPRRRIDVKVCMPSGLRCVVLYFKFH